MEEDNIDTETGELFPRSTSEAAIKAGFHNSVAQAAASLGIGNTALNAAIFAAVQKMPVWVKAESLGARGKYAKLPAILTVVRPLLFEQGIRIRQGTSRSWPFDDGGGAKGRLIPVFTDLIHTPSGQVERTEMEVPLPKMDPMGMGAAITYGRRWTLLAACALATDEADDDGEAAKLSSVSDKPKHDSTELAALTAEMIKLADETKLIAWSNEPKQQKRFSALGEKEQFILSQRYEDQKLKIHNGEIEVPAAKKAKP